MIRECRDVSLPRHPSSVTAIGVFHGAFFPGTGRVAEPGLRSDLSLKMRLADKLSAAVRGDRLACQMG